MVKRKSKRVVYLDMVKFLAIWMVCIGHSYSLVTMDSPSILNRWIYSFHMPLFMLLCGYFSLNSFQKTFLVFKVSDANKSNSFFCARVTLIDAQLPSSCGI